MRNPFWLILLVAISIASPSLAIGPGYVTTIEEAPARVAIGFYATTCPEAVRAECGYVEFVCEGSKLALVIEGFDSQELGEWLQKGLSAAISGASSEDLSPTSMFLTEENGWSVRFEFSDGLTWLHNSAVQGELNVSEFHGTVPLSIGPKDQANFARFLLDCDTILATK